MEGRKGSKKEVVVVETIVEYILVRGLELLDEEKGDMEKCF